MSDDVSRRINVLNEVSLAISEESHTILNPLKWVISNNWMGDTVEFCGYNIPHPSEKIAHMTIQFEDKQIQNPKNLMKKMYEGLECLELIGTSLLDKLEILN